MPLIESLSEYADNGGIYIHIPFCHRKCPYCDFFSISDLSQQHRYIEAILKEVELAANEHSGMVFDTIYMGGGTPSVLPPEAIDGIIESVQGKFAFATNTEVTIEINPGTLDLDTLRRYHTTGINRVNIGVQSFQEINLRFLERIHTAVEADTALEGARKAGFENIGIDLIYGLPGQSVESWIKDLGRALAYLPEHLSCYALTYEQGTPLAADMESKKFLPADDEQVAKLYLYTVEVLQSRGYEQYETSNFARSSDYRSRHNGKYWNLSPYLGMGPSSHSYFPPERYWSKADLVSYLDDLDHGRRPIGGRETLSREQLMIEAVYLGLRLSEGVDIDRFDRIFGEKFNILFNKPLAAFVQKGLLEITSGRCRLNTRGMLLLDTIASSFIDQI